MATTTIEVISDPICSWCFLAHRVLLKAVQLYRRTVPNGSADHFNIIYLPYYLLDPATPLADKQELKDQSRNPRNRDRAYTRITQIGRAYGISFNFSDGKIGGTREAHRLIQLAQSRQSREVRDRILEGIFSAFHEKALDITDWDVLRSIAIGAGMQAKEVDEWKDDKNIGAEQLDFELGRARELVDDADTRGVPVVLVQGKYRFDGAPDVAELLEAFSSIKNGNDEVQNHTSAGQC
ncbi:hypothetical protein UA08_00932 [Talaromyces atroroseus]|uniref:DSBA-like thioredoxin domain-containing protein n=1 Tax=Talaromyces atroroseus TaxID=1441469 RepID=A0A225B3I1_TALAT|nr:hypothetical protein UA08_00932 [Talaromyces atroroseus]OKL64268.1 hypothetical protein UA08_00932 [Talaromyces atroroseus]